MFDPLRRADLDVLDRVLANFMTRSRSTDGSITARCDDELSEFCALHAREPKI
jgi:hypothetical protein